MELSVNIALSVGPGFCCLKAGWILRVCQRDAKWVFALLFPLWLTSVSTLDCDWRNLGIFGRGGGLTLLKGRKACKAIFPTVLGPSTAQRALRGLFCQSRWSFLETQAWPSTSMWVSWKSVVSRHQERPDTQPSLPPVAKMPALALNSFVLSNICFLGFCFKCKCAKKC